MSDWKNMEQWEMVLPPSRPTVEELDRIEKYIGSYSRAEPIAILGSTPEFRDLLYRMGFKKRFIFDKSIDFYQRMSKLLPLHTIDGEQLIVGEWLDTLQKFKGEFRVILSDLTMGNISYSDRYAFYQAIANALVFEGTFIDKALVFDFEVPTIDELFRKYEQLPINLRTINDFSSEVLFCSELVYEKKRVDSTELYCFIDNGEFSDKIKYFSKVARMITPEGFTWDYGIPWSELSNVYSSFYSEQVSYPNEDSKSSYFGRTKQFFNIK